jgi:hypothetical protein
LVQQIGSITYVVSLGIGLLFLSQVVSLFLNIHDNIEDVRNKTINPDFSVDLEIEKESSFTANINSIIVIITIITAIILASINLTRHHSGYEGNNSTSFNSENQLESSENYKIGDEKDGGIVFEIDLSGKNGLIVDKQDLGEMSWKDAIKACENKGDGWRLPTKEELVRICKSNSCNLDHAVYWSGTPSNSNPNYAWYFDRGELNGIFEYEKSTEYSVRAVKPFGSLNLEQNSGLPKH